MNIMKKFFFFYLLQKETFIYCRLITYKVKHSKYFFYLDLVFLLELTAHESQKSSISKYYNSSKKNFRNILLYM